MDNYDNSIVGILNKKKKINILNSAVPSYSPTTYLHSYKKNLENNILSDKHVVLLALDISDVQDEAGRWITKKDSLLYDYGLNFTDQINSRNPSIVKEVLNKETKENILKKNNLIVRFKNFVVNNLKFSSIFYRAVKFSFLGYDLNIILNTSRSAFTWRKWDELDLHYEWYMDNFDRGYKPLGVRIALEKIKNKTVEIANLAKKNNSKIYLVIYPWPGQLVNRNEIFSWTDFVDDLCNISNCNGVINTFDNFKNYSNKNINWYHDLYIEGDIHFNKNGNEIIAEEISKIIF